MDDHQIEKRIKDGIAERILGRIDPYYLAEVCDKEEFVVIAGNSLNKPRPHDIDVYKFVKEDDSETPVKTIHRIFVNLSDPVVEVPEMNWCKGHGGPHRIVYESANARTVKHDDDTYQYCAYQKPFHKLIESFDYAHVQVGAKLNLKTHKIDEVYFTDAYLNYLLTGKTCFTGSEFPLSSLLRAEKYKRYEVMNASEFRECVLVALGDVIQRGFVDYEDFKRQIQAVDLLLLEEGESNAAFRFYKICEERGLVKNPRHAETVEEAEGVYDDDTEGD